MTERPHEGPFLIGSNIRGVTCITGIAMHRMGATALVHNKKLDYAPPSFTVTCAASTPSASMGFFLVVRPRVVVYLLCLLLCLD